jgi:hypothetical protein
LTIQSRQTVTEHPLEINRKASTVSRNAMYLPSTLFQVGTQVSRFGSTRLSLAHERNVESS